MPINIELYENFDGSLDGRYKQGNKPSATSGGTPALAWAAPNGLVDGETLTITTDGTYDFGTKANTKPLLFWTADGGDYPNLELGRTVWNRDDSGSNIINYSSVSTEIVAPNATQSYTTDHGRTSDMALGWTRLDHNNRDVYVCRKHYADFDLATSYGARTRFTLSSGDFPVEGDTITGQTSGATGTVWYVEYGTAHDAIHYDTTVLTDTINFETAIDFVLGETMLCSNGAVLVNTENPSGRLKSTNYKTMRCWGEDSPNNSYPIASYDKDSYNFNHENTDTGTFYPVEGNLVNHKGFEWLSQEVAIRQSSAADVADATMRFRQNDEETVETGIITRGAGQDNYGRVYQVQVSNGMAKGSNTYWNSLYVDDSFSRVMIGNAPIWSACTEFEPQPYSAWGTGVVTVTLYQGAMSTLSGAYIYMIDADDTPVSESGVQL